MKPLFATGKKLMLFVFFATVYSASGQQSPSQDNKLDPTVKMGKLANGFTYFIKKANNPADKVLLRLAVNAGTWHEDEDQLGLAHLLEHVAFNGTKHFPHDKVMEYFNSAGFQPGNDWNASTGKITSYFINAPINNPEVLANTLQIIRDWAGDMQLDPKEIDDERGVVLGESRGSNSASWRMELMADAVILDHPRYASDRTEKHDKSINTFKTDALVRFYKDWYRPDLEALIVVGNIDVDEMEKKIKALFSDLKMPDQPRKVEDFAARYAVELKNKNKFVALTDKELQEISVKIYQKKLATLKVIRSANDLRSSLIDKLYNEMITVRLGRLTETDKKPFNQASNSIERNAFHVAPQLDALSTYITLEKSQSIKTAIAAVVAELKRVAKDGFLPDELKAAVQKIEREAKNQLKYENQNSALAYRYQDYFIDGALSLSPDKELELKIKLLHEIKLDEINGVSASWINDNKNTDVVIFAPEDKNIEIPDQSTAFKWLAAARKIKLPAYSQPEMITGEFIKDDEIPKVDKAAAIKSVAENDELEIKQITFSNGMRLLLKKTPAPNGAPKEINLYGYRPGGMSNYSGNDANNARNLHYVSNKISSKYDQQQMFKFLNERNMYLNMFLEKNISSIKGACNEDDLEMLLQLLYLQMSSPVKDKTAFEKSIKERKEEIKRKMNVRNVNAFYDSVTKLLYKTDNPEYRTATLEELDQLNLDKIYDIYRKEFDSPAAFTMLVSGDFDENKVTDLFVKYFAAFKSAERKETFPTIQPRELSGKLSRTFYMGENKGALVRLYFPGKYNYTLKNDLMLGLLENALSIKIWNRLREKEGGTYTPSTNSQHSIDMAGNYMFVISFDCETGNVEHMVTAAVEEFNNLKNEGLTEEILQQAKSRMKQRIQKDFISAGFWSEYLVKQYANNLDTDEILKRSSVIDLLSLDAINKAAKEYLPVDNMSRFVLMPESIETRK